jgi:predicted RNA methylase
MQKENRKLN